jgi:hypothetical protein
MRSRFENLHSLIGDLSDPSNPYRSLSLVQLEQLARAQRTIAIGEALGDGLLWLMRLPARLRAMWTPSANSPRVLERI